MGIPRITWDSGWEMRTRTETREDCKTRQSLEDKKGNVMEIVVIVRYIFTEILLKLHNFKILS